jgi:hypothetical protein
MKFSVEFVGEKKAWVIGGMRERGLCALDAARAKLGSHISDVRFYPMSDQAIVTCTIDEETARRAAHVFGRFNAAEVCVPASALNQYVVFSYREEKGVGVQSMDVDAERLINDWLTDGAPLDWEPPGYKFEEPEPAPEPEPTPDSNAEPSPDLDE